MKRRAMLLMGAALLAGAACNRWTAGYPRRVALGTPEIAYDATLQTLKLEGYRIQNVQEQTFTIHAWSKIDEHKESAEGTVMTFQCYDDGTLEVTFRGRLARESQGVIHRKLAEEVDGLLKRIHYAAVAMSG